MENDQTQRRELGAFLRARREALPATVPGRRRTPGLRREEVAALSNVSTTWYIWAEQGRDISLSPHALARVASALQLTPAERAYVFALAARLDPAPPHEPEDGALPPQLMALLGTIDAPAYVLDSSYKARVWNMDARDLLAPWLKSGEFNLLRYVFLYPNAREFIDNWAERAQRLVAEFHAETGQKADSPARRTLAESLCRESPEFAQYWNSFTVLGHEGGERRFNHPERGAVRYVQHNLVPVAHPGYRLVILKQVV